VSHKKGETKKMREGRKRKKSKEGEEGGWG
jgi:hypothetical protein